MATTFKTPHPTVRRWLLLLVAVMAALAAGPVVAQSTAAEETEEKPSALFVIEMIDVTTPSLRAAYSEGDFETDEQLTEFLEEHGLAPVFRLERLITEDAWLKEKTQINGTEILLDLAVDAFNSKTGSWTLEIDLALKEPVGQLPDGTVAKSHQSLQTRIRMEPGDFTRVGGHTTDFEFRVIYFALKPPSESLP
jgi:hypothetical protein